ncbi:MAG: hypothetical protein HN403_20530 [Rhodospirillales bacterium]|jgi:hypothetical protein|nr:hypothetical protein [Rhodospirillales bacterium]
MVWTQYIDQEFNCVVVIHKDELDALEPLAQLMELVNHPDHRKGMNVLRDARRGQAPPSMNYQLISANRQKFSETNKKLGKCRLANVTGSDVNFGIGNQVSLILEESPVERMPFLDMVEAKRWLGLPDDYREDLVPNELLILSD